MIAFKLPALGGGPWEPLEDPLTSHCVLCESLRWLSELELFTPEPEIVQLRCRRELGCRIGEERPVYRIETHEEPDGTLSFDEISVAPTEPEWKRPNWLSRLLFGEK